MPSKVQFVLRVISEIDSVGGGSLETRHGRKTTKALLMKMAE
jgi:hypothetical protein